MKRAFPMIMGRERAMMNFAGFPTSKRRQLLWCEAANTATMLDDILVHEQNSAPPYTMFYGQDAKHAKHLRTFGEICVTADISNKEGSVENPNTRLFLISCSQGILSSTSFSCYLLLRLLVYMYLSQLMRTYTNYLKCIVISS